MLLLILVDAKSSCKGKASKAEQPATGELHPTILTVQVAVKKHARTLQKQTLAEE